MAFTRRSYEEIRDSVLAQITKGIINEKMVYELNRTRYKLANTPVKSIEKVEGIVNGSLYTFKPTEDYGLTGDMLAWQVKGTKPDDKTVFFVNYVFGNPTGITDINPGSVVRTMVEAVSRELDFFYAQLNHIYLAGFIDTATGNALDLVVSILGVNRKPAEHATGMVTFGRSTDPREIMIERETHVYDGRTIYKLKSVPVKAITEIAGTCGGDLHHFEEGTDYQISGDGIEWVVEGKKPDPSSVFYVSYLAFEQIKIPAGTTVSTYARRPEDVKVFVTTEECAFERTPEASWEVDVPVKAMAAGTVGNVVAGTITVMPQPPVGVEYVCNRGDILSGIEEETDNELRERAKLALERAGKATLVSLESAIRVIDDTRAAGIKVEFAQPKTVHIDVSLTVRLKKKAVAPNVERELEAKVRSYLSSLNIGDDVVYSRIVGAALGVANVHDVTDVTLKAYRKEAEAVIEISKGNIEIGEEEKAVLRSVSILREREEKGGVA
jgi:uncharacterized phage protein gp47/JayE